jgi:sulfur carrier protein ThiS
MKQMKIKLNIFYPALMDFIQSPNEVIVSGKTVGECLRDFTLQFSGTDKWIFDGNGKLFEHVLVFINTESAQSATVNDAVKEGDVLLLVALIVGG